MAQIINGFMGYDVIFENDSDYDISKAVLNIPTVPALQMICHFNMKLHFYETDPSIQKVILDEWYVYLPVKMQQAVDDFIKSIKSRVRVFWTFYNYRSSLHLIDYLLKHKNDLVDELTNQQKAELFKAYLYCTSEWLSKQKATTEFYRQKGELKHKDTIEAIIATQFYFEEFSDLNDFRVQFVKASLLLKHLEQNEKTSKYLDLFLKDKKVASWREYLKILGDCYTSLVVDPNTSPDFDDAILTFDEDTLHVSRWLDNLVIDISDYQSQGDFLQLREKPLLRLNPNQIIFLDINFFINKVYHAIKFDISNVLLREGLFSKRVDIFSFLGQETEKSLLYEILNHCFHDRRYIKLTGSQIKYKVKDGEPDYYLRDKGKVYLFEFKDSIISANCKFSFDYESIESELKKKFVEKGISQLVSTIEKLVKNGMKIEDDLDYSNCIIYPILLTTDISLQSLGINHYLNKQFQNQIDQKQIAQFDSLKNLVVINLDTFIKYQNLFREKKLAINHCLNEYLKVVRSHNDTLDFGTFMHNRTMKLPRSIGMYNDFIEGLSNSDQA